MPAFAGMTLRSVAPRPHPAEMPRAKKGHDQRAKAEAYPFEDDISPFRGKFEQKGEAYGEVEKSPEHVDHGEDSPTPGGDANGLWNQWPLIP